MTGTVAGQSPAPAPPLKPALEDFVRPKLVLNGEGHTSPLRALAYTPDGAYLLSGGTDKVVHIWEVQRDRLRLVSSIRPPLNRRAGWVYAIATAGPLADKTYRVAVAGHGASLQAGEIGVYRLPPSKDVNSGDRICFLPNDTESKPLDERQGHSRPVYGLDFSADGRYLASCGQDRTIRVWDLNAAPRPKSVSILSGHGNEVTRVAFLPGDRLVSAGGVYDGTVRIWNWREGGNWKHWTRPSDEDMALGEGVRINAMAVSRDGHQIVVGRENGRLEAYSGADLSGGRLLNPGEIASRRPVEALAFSPDGKSLAVSVLKESPTFDPTILTRTDCLVTLRPMPEAGPVAEILTAGERVKALAFDPSDAARLAVGGGEAQAVIIRDVNQRVEIAERPGPGTVLWNVGFVDNNPTLAFARQRPVGGEAWHWEAFDLSTGRAQRVSDPARLATAIHAYQGWTVRAAVADRQGFLFTLLAVAPDGREIPLRLSPEEDVRWTCFTFVPRSRAGGDRAPMIAIGSLTGNVTFFTLPDARKTRVYSGHAEAVYALAPSPDGRWLATASADQTLRLWALRGSDQRPGIGAKLAPDARGGLSVTDVTPATFAWEMGLRTGDRVVRCSRNLSEAVMSGKPDDFVAAIRSVGPGTAFELRVRRGQDDVSLRSSARDALGAGLAPDARGGLLVGDVLAGSPAQAMGLRTGDRVLGLSIELPATDPKALDEAIRAIEPSSVLVFDTLRGDQQRTLQTPRRDPPALSLFVGRKLEWILWMPEGFYHSSVEGDRELLGWHVNREPIPATTTAFYPMSRFAAQLRRPAAIRALLAGGDVLAAIRQAQGVGAVQEKIETPTIVPPPRVRFVAPESRPGAEVEAATADLRLRIEAEPGGEGRRIRSLVVRNGNVPYTSRLDPALAKAQVDQVIPLHKDINTISIVATDDQGVTGIEQVRVRLKVPDTVPVARRRLLIRSIGVESFQGREFGPIRYAGEDARRLSDFLSHPESPDKPFFDPQAIDARTLTGAQVTAPNIRKEFEDLSGEAKSKSLGTGDSVFVFLESHVISLPSIRSTVLGTNAPDKPDAGSSVPAPWITEQLREVTSRGCLVVLLLDAIHEVRKPSQHSLDDLIDWIRDLTSDPGGGVIVLLASKQSPGQDIETENLGVFASAILGSMSVAGQAGVAAGAGSPTLDDFQTFVYNRVQELTERRQITGFYTPETLQPSDRDRIRIFEPQPPRLEQLAGRPPVLPSHR